MVTPSFFASVPSLLRRVGDPANHFPFTPMARDEYKLIRGGMELGVVTRADDDQPHRVGRFSPLPSFEHVRPLFDEEAELLHTDPSSERWRTIRDEIDKPGVLLEPYEWVGKRVLHPLIHIRGEEVWWR